MSNRLKVSMYKDFNNYYVVKDHRYSKAGNVVVRTKDLMVADTAYFKLSGK